MTNSTTKRHHTPQQKFRPVGECIYCGDRDKLTDEHIIPFSMGGNLVLPKSSCRSCAAITQRFEQTVARVMLGRHRLIHDYPSRNKKRRPQELDLEIEVRGETRTIMVPVSDYPNAPITFPMIPLPGVLRGAARTNVTRFVAMSVIPGLEDNDERMKRIEKRVGEPFRLKPRPTQILIGAYGCLIAKVAHSAAVATFGLGSFTSPFLPPIILGKDQCGPYYVGTNVLAPWMNDPKFRTGAHRMWLDLSKPERAGEPKYLMAWVQLFQDLNTPMYVAVIGLPSPELERRLRGAPPQEARL